MIVGRGIDLECWMSAYFDSGRFLEVLVTKDSRGTGMRCPLKHGLRIRFQGACSGRVY